MFDFPTTPAVDDEYTSGGVTYIWNGYGWQVKASGGAPPPVDVYTKAETDMLFVQVAGDTMTGSLTMAGAGANRVALIGTLDGVNRWSVTLNDATAETGTGNAGSDFAVNYFADDGTMLGTLLRMRRSGLTELTGNLTLASGGPNIILNDTGGTEGTAIVGTRAGVARWAVAIGSDEPESSGDLGTNFVIQRCNDAGVTIDDVFKIHRNSGLAYFTNQVNAPAMAVAAPPTGNARYYVTDETGASRGHFSWDRGTNGLGFFTDAGGAVYVSPSNVLYAALGVYCRSGLGGVHGANCHNMFWDLSGSMQLWVDALNLGYITVTSDYRLKKDVAPLPGMWDTVKALNPIKYTQTDYGTTTREDGSTGPLFAADNVERWGFIAHELQETLTMSAANGVKDAPNEIQSPNPFTVIAALTKALQEAMTRIEALEAA